MTQKDMVAGPNAMVVRAGLMRMAMTMIMPVTMFMAVRVPVRMQHMVVRHDASLARKTVKVA